MSNARSKAELVKFLDYVGAKGLLSPATANARKIAVNKVLGILDDAESADVASVDLDSVMRRFSKLEGSRYTPDSLQTYKSRVKSAIEDFTSYVADPLTFRPKGGTRERKVGNAATATKAEAKRDSQITATSQTQQATAPQPSEPLAVAATILNIPLRLDLTVKIQGLPFDLTELEARKIAGVVTALAMPTG